MNRIMKKTIFLLFAALTFGMSFAQVKPAEQDTINAEWLKANYTKREVMIKMRDGVSLFTAIYEPNNKKVKHPILMQRTCYSVSPYGEDRYAALWRSATEYVRNGYILVFQDVRGKNMSEGTYENIRPIREDKSLKWRDRMKTDEASDTYDTAEWLVKNTNNNGCIGQYGISYPGFYSTCAALSGHPAIKAVSPQAPVTDWFRGDDFHHNGAFFYLDLYSFVFGFEKGMVKEAYQPGFKLKSPKPVVRGDVYTDYLNMGAVKNFSATLGDSIVGWNEVMDHPNLDDYWESHNVSYHCHDVKPAVMVVGGLFDAEDCYGAFRTYEAIKEQSPKTELYLVDGPWSHGGWSRGATEWFGHVKFAENMTSEWYNKNIEYPFFAYYLEGKGDKPKPGAMIYNTGSCEWQYYPEGWSNKQATTPYYLSADGKLSTTKPSGDRIKSYVSDPSKPVPYQMTPGMRRTTTYLLDDQRFAAQRPDVLVYQTEPLTSSVTVEGEVEVELDVKISTTDADFVVKVIDVFPDGFSYGRDDQRNSRAPQQYLMSGYQMLVRGDIMRGKYRNSFAEPEPFEPGEKTKVKFTLPSMCHTFKPGHRIMIQVQSSWFPLVDRNPQKFCDIYHCDDSDFQMSVISIFNSSSVNLPVKK